MDEETWVHQITPETKVEYMTWKHPSSLTLPKIPSSAVSEEIESSMQNVCCSWISYCMIGQLTASGTVQHWTDRSKLFVKREQYKGVRVPRCCMILLPKTWPTWQKSGSSYMELIHLLYMPSDYHLFGPLKWYLSEKWFHTDEAVVAEVQGWDQILNVTFIKEIIYGFVHM